MQLRLTLALCLVATLAPAQTVPQLLSTISGTTLYREAAISPDGRWLAYTINLRNKDNTASRSSEMFLLDLSKPGAEPQRIAKAKGDRAEHSPAWSPDSRQIAF